MAPFGLSRAFSRSSKDKPSSLARKDSNASSLMSTTTTATNTAPGWKRVLKRKKPAPLPPGQLDVIDESYPPPQEQLLGGTPLMYAQSVNYARTPGPGQPRVLDESPQQSYRTLGGRDRHHAPSIVPLDSASNVHINHHPGHMSHRPMMGIVEEQSDLEYHRPELPLQTPGHGQPIVIGPSGSLHGIPNHHTGATYMSMPVPNHQVHHVHHQQVPYEIHQQESGLRPIKIMDAHGQPQQYQEIVLDGSGVQEIPLPSHGNVIFIVDAGTKLDVKDPVTGEYIPLDEYYANLAARPPPRQDVQVTVTGDASNLIIEDSDGRIIHRGAAVQTIPGSPSTSHGGSYIHEQHTGSPRSRRHHGHYHVS